MVPAPSSAERIPPTHTVCGADKIRSEVNYYDNGAVAPDSGINFDFILNLNANVNVNLMNCNSDYDCNSSQLESSSVASTVLKGPVTPSNWDQKLDLEALPCSQILGLANSFIGSQQSQSGMADDCIGSQQSQSGVFNVEQIATPTPSVRNENAKEEENGEVPATQEKKKNQKTSTYMNKKPGEKRQNKYYWPKIDIQKKPKTPKPVVTPKTPNLFTPKPKKKYPKKNKGIPEGQPKMPSKVLGKRMKNKLSCKRGLNFENEKSVGMGLDSQSGAFRCYPGLRKQAWVFKLGQVKSLTLKSISNPLTCNETTTTSTTISQIQPCSLQEEKVCNERVPQKYVKVYYRRFKSKCLKECQKLWLNYPKSCKRKRVSRDRKSFMGLKKFEGFGRFSVSGDLLDRIAIVIGKKRMMLPSNGGENSRKMFPCVLSLLSSPMKLSTRRRSTKRMFRPPPFIIESIDHENGGRAKLDSPSDVVFTETDINQIGQQVLDNKESNTENLIQTSNLQGASMCSSNIKVEGSKSKATKQKKGRPSKSKKNQFHDYLSGLCDWHDESLEQIMEPLVQHFESMALYDNPKTLERWSVLHDNDGENKGYSGTEESYEEKVKWEEERKTLLQRIAKFIYVMTRCQGPRDFVKWKGSVLDSIVGVFLTQNVSDVLSSNAYIELGSRYPPKSPNNENEKSFEYSNSESNQGFSSESVSSTWSAQSNVVIEHPPDEESLEEKERKLKEFDSALNDMLEYLAKSKGKGKETKEREQIDWDAIRVMFGGDRDNNGQQHRNPDTKDSIDWDAVRRAPVDDIAKAITGRGQQTIIAASIQRTLNRLVEQHGSLDVEWLREAPPQVAKAYLLSFHGLGLKSVECLRLLTLHHHGFPVDVNIARVSIRLGWVPLKPLPMGLPFHLLEKYPLEADIQKYLWPRLCHLDQKILYKLHCHMITFGKVFCVKKSPNCGACPFKGECKYYTSVITSKLQLPRTPDRRALLKPKKSSKKANIRNLFDFKPNFVPPLSLPISTVNSCTEISTSYYNINRFHSQKSCEPIIEMPPSPEPEPEPESVKPELTDIEDLFTDSNNDEFVAELKLNFSEEFKPEVYDYYYFDEKSMNKRIVIEHGNEELSRALVSLSPEEAFIPLPKHMLNARLRTEHQVYEIPDGHPLLNFKDLERRDEKDHLPYLLAVWVPDQIKKVAELSEELDKPCCSQKTGEYESLTIPGTLLIPSRTAMRGYFPLNGTYFQVNEVFADDESSERPIDVPRRWLWNLRKRTLYCGSGITSIFRGLTWREIQRCCCAGFVCTRGFNRETRAPSKLHSRLHVKTKLQEDDD